MGFDPVNPDATPAARALLARISALAGEATLTGQHNTPRELSHYSDQAERITGHYPAVWGQDFGFSADGDMDGVEYRPAVIAEAKKQHAAGSIVTLMWHAVRPTHDEPVTFDGNICDGKLADDHWRELLTEGTALHRRWEDQVDVIAGFLAQLRDADVPVLWRPYHEMNGDWFWWCGRPGSDGYEALYRQLYRRFVDVHGLHNLIWVWNANAPREKVLPHSACYPGHDVVDILATDVYANDYRQSHHDDLVELAEGRPIALGEVGVLPGPELFERQPRWAWFMTWTEFLTRDNEPDAVRALYDMERAVNRG